MMKQRLILCLVVVFVAGCASLEYDLEGVRVPVSAKAADPSAAEVKHFEIEVKSTLWVHGLLGHGRPNVAALIADKTQGYDRIANFRVSQGAGFHDWLITHLTLTLIRLKTVKIEGDLVRD